MATTVGSHTIATFTSPVNGTTPIDANTVRGNDNTIQTAYNAHDSDTGIHVQSSTLAARPAAGDAGRKWMTLDGTVLRLWQDTGSSWVEAAAAAFSTARTLWGQTFDGTANVSGSLSSVGDIAMTGALSGATSVSATSMSATTFTGALTGNASTATALQTARTLWGQSFNGTANVSGALTGVTTIAASGTITQATGLFGNGTVGAPAIAASADTDTGIYFPAADTIGFAVNGAERMRLSAAGDLRLTNAGAPFVYAGTLGVVESGFQLDVLNQRIEFYTAGGLRWRVNASGNLLAGTDNAFDIGASGASRPRDLFVGRNTTITGNLTVDGSTFAIDATSEKVAIGGTQSGSNNYGVPQLGVMSNAFGAFHVESHNDTAGNFSFIGLMRSRGTQAAPTHVQSGDTLGVLTAQAYNDAGVFPYRGAATVGFIATATHTVGSLPTAIFFSTTPSGSNSPAERMRLDGAGVLGLGVTPSVWASSYRIAQLGGYAAVGASTDVVVFANNWRDDGANKYLNNGFASQYMQYNGQHRWYVAPSGTAGAALTFAQAMTLDANGNLGIGVVPRSGWSSVFDALQTGGGYFSLASQNITTSRGSILWGAYGSGDETFAYTHTGDLATRYSQQYDFRWSTAPSGTVDTTVTFTERMRLDSSGNLGLGVTPAAWTVRAIELGGTPALSTVTGTDLTYNAFFDGAWKYRGTATAMRYSQVAGGGSPGSHQWFTAPSGTAGNAITFTQAMTLDASGNLGVGATTVSEALHVARGASLSAYALFAGGGNTAATAVRYGQDSGGSGYVWNLANGSIFFGTNNTQRWRIDANGHFITGADNLYDIGASGATRPRDLHLGGNMVGGGWVRAGAASAGAASTTTIGSTTATTVGAAGGASALPATPLGYIIAHVGTTQVKIPYYNA